MDKRKEFYIRKGICKICGKKKYLSRNKNCIKCATEKVKLANLEMKHKEGPIYDKWKIKVLEKI